VSAIGPDGGAGQSVKSARYQEHSTRLRDRCEYGCPHHTEGAEHEHATPAIDVTRNAAGEHKGAKHQLPKGDGHLHHRGRCIEVVAHRTQRKIRDCVAQLVREADQHASGEKPPAMLHLGRWLFIDGFGAHCDAILGPRFQTKRTVSGIMTGRPRHAPSD
jgi:hypothetical protein